MRAFPPVSYVPCEGGAGALGEPEWWPLGCPLLGGTTPGMAPSLPPQGHREKEPFGEEKWPRRGFVPAQDGAQ